MLKKTQASAQGLGQQTAGTFDRLFLSSQKAARTVGELANVMKSAIPRQMPGLNQINQGIASMATSTGILVPQLKSFSQAMQTTVSAMQKGFTPIMQWKDFNKNMSANVPSVEKFAAAMQSTVARLQQGNTAIMPWKQFSKDLGKIGAAAKEATGIMGQFVSMLGRIAVFSVVAGVIVRGFFAIIQAIKDAVSAGLDFNKQMEQGSISIAALLTSSRQLANATGAVVEPLTAYQLNLAKARDLQEQILLLNVTTLGTGQELQVVFQRVLAFTQNQAATDQERLQLSQSILNAAKLLGLNEAQVAEEARQILTLESARGQQILNSLGITIQQAREYQKQGTLVQFLNNALSTYSIISGEIALTWEGLVSTVSTFFSIIAGAAFEDTFVGLKAILAGMAEGFKKLRESGDITSVLDSDEESLRQLGVTLADVAATGIRWVADWTNRFISQTAAIAKAAAAVRALGEAFSAGPQGFAIAKAGVVPGTDLLPSEVSQALAQLGKISEVMVRIAITANNLARVDIDVLKPEQLTSFAKALLGTQAQISGTIDKLEEVRRATGDTDGAIAGLIATLKDEGKVIDFLVAEMEKFKNAKNAAETAAEKFRESLNETLVVLKAEVGALEAAAASGKTLAEAQIDVAIATAAAKGATKEQLETLRNLLERQDAANRSIRDGIEAVNKMIASLEEQIVKLRTEVLALEAAAAAGKTMAEAEIDVAVAQAAAQGATEKQIKALRDLLAAKDKATNAIRDREEALRDIKKAEEEAAEAVEKHHQELKDLEKETRAETALLLEQVAIFGSVADKTRTFEQATHDAAVVEQKAALEARGLGEVLAQDLAEGAVTAQEELDKTKESAEALSKGFLSVQDAADIFEDVIRGIAQGTADLSTVFQREGAALGATLIKGILFGKEKLEGQIIGNLTNLVGPHGIIGGLFEKGGVLAGMGLASGIIRGVARGGLTGGLIGLLTGSTGAGVGGGLGAFLGSFSGFAKGIASALPSFITNFLGQTLGITIGMFSNIILPGIGVLLGFAFEELFGSLFAHIPTKGTQIRKAVVGWLKDIGVSFADEVKSGRYFFEATKELAEQVFGGDFLAASKQILEEKAGPELARQLQALGTFVTADMAKKLGKPLEQTGTTFGNMLIANLGIERIPEAIDEIIQKSGITFGALVEKLSEVFKAGAIGAEFYGDAIRGAVDIFFKDFPASIDVAKLAMESFNEEGIFDLEAFAAKFEEIVKNVATIGQAAAEALMQGIEEGLSAEEVGDLFMDLVKEALRAAAIEKFVAEFIEDLFADIDLTEPLELSSEEMEELRKRVEEGSEALRDLLEAAGLLPEILEESTNEADRFLASLDQIGSSLTQDIMAALTETGAFDTSTIETTLQSAVSRAVLQGIIDAIVQTAILEPIMGALLQPFRDAMTIALEDGKVDAAEIATLLAVGAAAMAGVPDAIAVGVALLEGIFNDPNFQAMLETIQATTGAAVIDTGGGATVIGGGPPGQTLQDLQKEQAEATEDATEAIDAFIESLDDTTNALQDLIDAYLELVKQVEAATPGAEPTDPAELINNAVIALDLLASTLAGLTDELVKLGIPLEDITGLIAEIVAVATQLSQGIVDEAAINQLIADLKAFEEALLAIPWGDAFLLISTMLIPALDLAIDALEKLIDSTDGATDGANDLADANEAFAAEVQEIVAEFVAAGAAARTSSEDINDFLGGLEDLSTEFTTLFNTLETNRELLEGVGLDVDQMQADITASFEAQARAMGEALKKELTDPATEAIDEFNKRLAGTFDTFADASITAANAVSAFNQAFASGDMEGALALAEDTIDAQIALIQKTEELRLAFQELVDTIGDDIQDLIRDGMLLEGRVAAGAANIANMFARLEGTTDFEERLRLVQDLREAILQQFDDQVALLEESRDASIAALEERRDAEIELLNQQKEARRAELEARRTELDDTVQSLNDRIDAHRRAEDEIAQVEQNIAQLQVDIRKRDLTASVAAIDERIRIAEQANDELLRSQEQADQDRIRLQEQTNEELIRSAEAFRQAAESIREAIDSILLSEVSPFTPLQRLQEAQRQFQALVTAARGGDVEAARALGGSAQQLLSEASAFFASSAPFQAIFGETIKTLEELGIQFDQKAALTEQEIIARTLGEIVLTGGESVEQLKAIRDTLQRELTGLDKTLEQQLMEQQGRLRELKASLEDNIDELVTTRDALVQELENIGDELGNLDDVFEPLFEQVAIDFDDSVRGVIDTFEDKIGELRGDTIRLLESLQGHAGASVASLEEIERQALATLEDIANNKIPEAVDAIVQGVIDDAMANTHWMQEAQRQDMNEVARWEMDQTRQHLNEVFRWFQEVQRQDMNEVAAWMVDQLGSLRPGNSIPRLQGGGIVMEPILSLIGDRGPEAVLPLRRAGSPTIDIDYKRLGEAVAEAMAGRGEKTPQNLHIQVVTEDGKVQEDRIIRRFAEDSESGRIMIHSRGVGRYRRGRI